jgi:hypothetical protein
VRSSSASAISSRPGLPDMSEPPHQQRDPAFADPQAGLTLEFRPAPVALQHLGGQPRVIQPRLVQPRPRQVVQRPRAAPVRSERAGRAGPSTVRGQEPETAAMITTTMTRT